MSEYFAITKPISKDLFIQSNREIHKCLQLLTLPLGISDKLIDTFRSIDRDESILYKTISNQHKQWEETLSRRIYAKNGVTDEQIAATIHQYIEKEQDNELITEIQSSDMSLQRLLNEQTAIEIPIVNLSVDELTAKLVAQVLTSVLKCFDGLVIPSDNVESNKLIEELFFSIDYDIYDKLSVYVPMRSISPFEFNYQAISNKCLSNESIDDLINSLTVTIDDHKTDFSPLQYFTLLRVSRHSEAVISSIAQFNESLSIKLRESLTKRIDITNKSSRCHLPIHLLLCLPSIDPLVSYFTQLCDKSIDNLEIESAYVSAKRSIYLLESAADASKNESNDKALEIISDTVESLTNSEVIIPTFLKVKLLVSRAEYQLEDDPEAALVDLDKSLSLDRRCVDAYRLRSRYHNLVALTDEAAFDSLAAFVLGGSSDLSLAAIAEETIGQSIRQSAKTIFYERINENQLTELTNDLYNDIDQYSKLELCRYPKSWLVASYFTGYELLSDAFTVLPLFIQTNKSTGAISDIDSDDVDIPDHLLQDSLKKLHDTLAYHLIRQIVEGFDALFDSQTESKSGTLVTSERLYQPIDAISSEEFSAYQSRINTNELILIDEDILSEEFIENNFLEEFIDDDSDVPSHCSAYLTSLMIFRSPECEVITGVSFNVDGSVNRVDEEREYSTVSSKLRARLVNLCGSLAYLSGDSIGALKCFRLSKLLDNELLDSYIKLGALLVDMDDIEEASELYAEVKAIDPGNPYLYIHQAEATLSLNEYQLTTQILKQAKRIASQATSSRSYSLSSELIKKHGDRLLGQALLTRIEKRRVEAIGRLESNLYALEGIALFRLDPNNLMTALNKLKEGIHFHNKSQYLYMCLGELVSQTGDMVQALNHFKRAHELDRYNPMPFVNASRVYQQLSYTSQIEKHINKAISLDPTLTMTYVDISQVCLSNGQTDKCLSMLSKALQLARHVSEIKDVLTAQAVGKLTRQLEDLKIYLPTCKSF